VADLLANPASPKSLPRVAILGGGQLSRMLLEVAPKLGISPWIFCQSKDEPAALLTDRVVLGDFKTSDGLTALQKLFSKTDAILFENEFIPCDLLTKVAADSSSETEIQFYPPLRSMRELQNKLNQKKLLETLNIPTSAYSVWNSDVTPHRETSSTLKEWISSLTESAPLESWVFKWATNGYDGKGVLLPKADDQSRVEAFCLQAEKAGNPVFAEKKIHFQKEVAIIGCRSVSGAFAAYPLVVSTQDSGICRSVVGPAKTILNSVGSTLEAEASAYAEKIATASNLVGSFGVEFFLDANGKIWVNEIAPRVHNTGHYTQNIPGMCSQFENHLRAVLGLPLGPTTCDGTFAMLNLLGTLEMEKSRNAQERGKTLKNDPQSSLIPRLENAFFHWYAKENLSHRRKLGHLNAYSATGASPETLLQELIEIEKNWQAILVAE
jgi:5-(carboxyamino)imidazole ribonucleotide synthase